MNISDISVAAVFFFFCLFVFCTTRQKMLMHVRSLDHFFIFFSEQDENCCKMCTLFIMFLISKQVITVL